MRLSDIYKKFAAQNLFAARLGEDRTIAGIAPIEEFDKDDLVFVEHEALIEKVKQQPPAGVVTCPELCEKLLAISGLGILVSENVKLAQALLGQAFNDPRPPADEWPNPHPSAVIHESAYVSSTSIVGPGVVIGKNAKIGEWVVMMANAVVEHHARIGDHSIIQSGVFVGHHCRIGCNVILKPGCIIGAEGFGFAFDEQKRTHRIPQTGIVVIEDDVIVGANCTVDRATYTETRIGKGCKLDALCHIAHNVTLGEDCVIVAQTGIAGSTRFGKRVIATGQTGTLDHKTVVDDVVLVHRCGVTEDITEPGTYATTPPQPFREYTRNIATFRKLFDLRQRLQRLEKKVEHLLKS
ncbi:MAG: UDP-3-O-(3-hydroxymyristoyl)glucosamine N-acyltransferase [Gammaproteobacteria bacterium]|nr:UDP-3-O-(3-hydroxymyristoyl)glucosamine N-acyltransferase [Gammaproteobacteria bacterium]